MVKHSDFYLQNKRKKGMHLLEQLVLPNICTHPAEQEGGTCFQFQIVHLQRQERKAMAMAGEFLLV